MTGGAEEFGQRGNGKWDCPVERNLALQNSHCSNGLARVATQHGGRDEETSIKTEWAEEFRKTKEGSVVLRNVCQRARRQVHKPFPRSARRLAREEKRKCGARNRSRKISHRRQRRQVELGKNALVVQRVAKDDERLGQHGNGFLAGGAAAHPGGIVERTD